MLQQRVGPVWRDMVVGMTLHVVMKQVSDLARGAPGMPRVDPLEPAVAHADTAQSVMLDVIDDLHRGDHAKAKDGKDQEYPRAAHPIHQHVPRRGLEDVAPERIRIVPDRQVAARQPVAFKTPGFAEAAGEIPGQVPPEALPLGRGPGVGGHANKIVMHIHVLGRILRVRHIRQQEFGRPALPNRALMD